MDLVREADHDRYVASLYAPEDRRAGLIALHAFNVEIAGIRDRIRQPLTGEIRLQWWRDAIGAGVAATGGEDVEGEGAGAGNPVAEALLETIDRHDLPRQALQNYLDARIFDLYDDPMPSRGDLEGYCGETTAALLQLCAMVLDPKAAIHGTQAAGHAGCALAIAGMLRHLPLHRRRGQCYVPRDLLASAGTSPEEFVTGDGGPNAVRAVAAMIALGREHLSAFEQDAASLPPALRPAFLPLAATGAQLAKMQGRERAMLDTGLDIAAWRKHWLMFRRATRGW